MIELQTIAERCDEKIYHKSVVVQQNRILREQLKNTARHTSQIPICALDFNNSTRCTHLTIRLTQHQL